MSESVQVCGGPPGEAAFEDYAVTVNGEPAFVYAARVSAVPFNQVWPGYQRPLDQTELAGFAYWDMAGPVTVRVESKRPVESVAVRPRSLGIQPRVEGNTITFDLARPGQVVVEVNGLHHALHLFANPPEGGAPEPGPTGVRYFGPGVHDAGKIELRSGETVYIAGGAVVYGAIEARDATNIRILGRGILDCSRFERGDVHGAVALCRCRKAVIDGVILRDPSSWTVIPAACTDVAISNIKLIGLWRYNADGIDVVNSRNVAIRGCFVRSFDDSIVVKGLQAWGGCPTGDLPVENVAVSDCVVWNDWGRALEIGAETCAPAIRDLAFDNCDILRTVDVAMDVQHGDRAEIRNLAFRNIRVEVDDEPQPPQFQKDRDGKYDPSRDRPHCPRLLVLEIRKNNYSKDEECGSIRNVAVSDVNVTGRRFCESYLSGHDESHRVESVAIRNLRFNGRPVPDIGEARFHMNEHVRRVAFRPGPT
ncbi:MAG TPA: glycosyl hydrolase family 28 protein [Phycisphaerae bacterium]|nr:glycosyl hydrolase family 28 protein [Phycisphaerae bacterium]